MYVIIIIELGSNNGGHSKMKVSTLTMISNIRFDCIGRLRYYENANGLIIKIAFGIVYPIFTPLIRFPYPPSVLVCHYPIPYCTPLPHLSGDVQPHPAF